MKTQIWFLSEHRQRAQKAEKETYGKWRECELQDFRFIHVGIWISNQELLKVLNTIPQYASQCLALLF